MAYLTSSAPDLPTRSTQMSDHNASVIADALREAHGWHTVRRVYSRSHEKQTFAHPESGAVVHVRFKLNSTD